MIDWFDLFVSNERAQKWAGRLLVVIVLTAWAITLAAWLIWGGGNISFSYNDLD